MKRVAAFTFIEILAVLAIIAVLLGLVIGLSKGARDKAKQGKARTEIEKIHDALQEYMLKNGAYPNSLTDISITNYPRTFTFDCSNNPLDPWGKQYQYSYSLNSPHSFTLFSYGPEGTNSNPGEYIRSEK